MKLYEIAITLLCWAAWAAISAGAFPDCGVYRRTCHRLGSRALFRQIKELNGHEQPIYLL